MVVDGSVVNEEVVMKEREVRTRGEQGQVGVVKAFQR